MEKKIEFDNIITFIEKAIENNLDIRTSISDWGTLSEMNICIYNIDDSSIIIQYTSEKNKPELSITKNYLNWVYIEISEMESARFRIEVLKAQEYSKNKLIEYFNNFFKEDKSKLTDINDLDNEDD